MCEKCILCEGEAKACEYPEKSGYKWYECPNCGKYIISTDSSELSEINRSKLVTYLFYHSFVYSSNIIYFIGNIEGYKSFFADNAEVVYLSNDEVENWYPRKFSEKIDMVLLALGTLAKNYTSFIRFTGTQFDLLCFIPLFEEISRTDKNIRKKELKFILEYIDKKGYFYFGSCDLNRGQAPYINGCEVLINHNGWLRIDELQRVIDYNKNVFVAMSFADEAKQTREAIRQGIISAGYSPKFIDEVIHNHQIVPEMLRLIRESRFLILEISDPNYGAYYEAGYALGLGKEVIVCCSKDVFTKSYETEEEQKYQKYLRPHFDIAQKQILVWNDYEDLTHKLSEWIKAIVG